MDLDSKETHFCNSFFYSALRNIHKNALCNLWKEENLPISFTETKTRLNQLRHNLLPDGVADRFNLRKLCFLNSSCTVNKTRMLCSLFATFPPIDVVPSVSNLVQHLECVPQFGVSEKPEANSDIFGGFQSSGALGAVCIICKVFLTVSGDAKRFVHTHARQDPVTYLFFNSAWTKSRNTSTGHFIKVLYVFFLLVWLRCRLRQYHLGQRKENLMDQF